MLLQQGVSVPDVVQPRHGVLQLLQPPAEVLLGPRATGEVRLHHLAQGEVVPCIRTLTRVHTSARLAWAPHGQRIRLRLRRTHVNESGDVMKVVLLHGGVGCSQVQEVLVPRLAAFQVDFLNFALSLWSTSKQLGDR